MAKPVTFEMYRLEDADGKHIGDFNKSDLRTEIDRLANGQPWGWRAAVDGADAICDFRTIARAMPYPA